MAHGSADLYGNEGSVPNATPVNGSGAEANPTRASAQDFGGQVGGAIQNAGQTGENVVNQFGGLIMETAANQAELGYIKAAGDLKAKYSQYEGLQAEAMRPQYEADLSGIHQQYRANLPLLAQKQFDANTIRSLGNQTSEYSGYAAGQVKSANLQSNDALATNAAAQAGNLPAVTDPTQFGGLNGTVIHAANSVADIKGWAAQATGTDPNTGRLTFGDSPDAKATKAQYDQYTDEKLAKLYMTGAKTVADNQGTSAAADWAKQHWDMMPDAAKVQMNQYLAPKMVQENIGGAIAGQNAKLEQGWNGSQLSNIPSSPISPTAASSIGSNANNLGNVKTAQGATKGTQEFVNPATPVDGVVLTANTLRTGYEGMTLQQIGKKWTGESDAKVADWVKNASGASGLSSDTVPDLNDPKQLSSLLKGIATAEKSPADRANFTDDVLAQGVQASLSGKQPENAEKPSTQAYPNKAEYLRAQEGDYVNSVTDAVAKQYPDDYYKQQIAERRAKTEIQRQISVEDNRLKSDRDTIQNAIGGGLTKGTPPATYEELKGLPGMQDVLDRVHSEQGDFAGTIDTRIAKATHSDALTNTPNAYDAVQAALDTSENWTRQASIEYLSKGLGSDNPGYSISQKDFTDAKAAVDIDPTLKSALADHMKQIANANGNVDGKGQERAVQWYNQAMTAYKQNSAAGDKAVTPQQFIENIGEKDGPPAPAPPSRMQQISNWASSLVKGKDTAQEAQPPSFSSPDDPEFAKLPSGSKFMVDGKLRTKK